MISSKNATSLISNSKLDVQTFQIDTKESSSSKNLILAEKITAERDQPPFDRVAMDGIGIYFENESNSSRSYKIENIQKAGEPQKELSSKENCLEVMTGAVLPKGCNTVIPYEEITIKNGEAKINLDYKLKSLKNIHFQGSDFKKNEILINENKQLDSTLINLCLGQGMRSILIKSIPEIALVSTGDELIECDQNVLDHQIRKTNVYLLESICRNHFPLVKIKHYHLPDIEKEVFKTLKNIVADHKIIVLTGGVSKGKFDFVPSVLNDLNVKKEFHKIKQKPGKPMWFGVGPKEQLVFGLPGNPVSSAVCFRKYIIEFFYNKLINSSKVTKVILNETIEFKKEFTYFRLVNIQNINGSLNVVPTKMNGSGDLNALALSDGFVELNADQDIFKKGDVLNYFSWDFTNV